jgi:hypothetical protein
MRNDKLRLTSPRWLESVDTGGMFNSTVAVYEDPDGGPLPFLAVARGAWGAGGQARRATLEEAKERAWELQKLIG